MNTQLNTNHCKRSTEQGQALVLIVLAVIGLMGFAALAVDLGRVYSERRRAQNAVDAAALAWAYADSQVDYGGVTYTLADVQSAKPAYTSLLENDFQDIPDRVTIETYWPPISGPFGPTSGLSDEERSEYFQVFLTTRVDQIFSQFVFSASQTLTVEAVARAQPFKALYPGDALVASNNHACQAVWFQGSAGTVISGGNIFSDSNKTGTPASCHAGVQNGSGGVTVVDGGVRTVGDFDGSVDTDEGFTSGTSPQDPPDLPIPDCSGLTYRTYSNLSPHDPGPNVLEPGYYKNGIKVNSGEHVQLKGGMYCLQDDFTMGGGQIEDIYNAATNTSGVMIVMLNGSFNIGGNTVVSLHRMSDFVDPSGNPWHGMLLYMPYKDPWKNTGEVHIGGGGDSSYTGTIYAPGPRSTAGQYKCIIEGSGSSLGLASNVICDTVKITGSAVIQIYYVEEQNFRMRPSVELSQ